jgi:hypothetical protein
MTARRDTADKVVEMVRVVQREFPWLELVYVTMFQCHVVLCCEEHMTEGDVIVTDSIRRCGHGHHGHVVGKWWACGGFELVGTVGFGKVHVMQ